ncbi:hypothetical protein PPACK8108_LOCUS22550 [Phakopsora pachyrhizi]|uniref:Uncharacterized protein n=1 Tax=Phakopsora pachyrhizi TaxID=170000 RepID=A0AAV0BMK2_PHAPC|nr:hypothetical protein PPACK8108_LOCUS22550 [Phakopsora pachyrhizi]
MLLGLHFSSLMNWTTIILSTTLLLRLSKCELFDASLAVRGITHGTPSLGHDSKTLHITSKGGLNSPSHHVKQLSTKARKPPKVPNAKDSGWEIIDPKLPEWELIEKSKVKKKLPKIYVPEAKFYSSDGSSETINFIEDHYAIKESTP